jgi:hypothetical protein
MIAEYMELDLPLPQKTLSAISVFSVVVLARATTPVLRPKRTGWFTTRDQGERGVGQAVPTD